MEKRCMDGQDKNRTSAKSYIPPRTYIWMWCREELVWRGNVAAHSGFTLCFWASFYSEDLDHLLLAMTSAYMLHTFYILIVDYM